MISLRKRRSGKNTPEDQEFKAQTLKWMIKMPVKTQLNTLLLNSIVIKAITGIDKFEAWMKILGIITDRINQDFDNDYQKFEEWLNNNE